MDKKRMPMPSVGASSLIIIFAVLCLTVFALLSLSTVQANSRLCDQAIRSVTDYYEADCRAEKLLAELRNGEMPDDVWEQDGTYCYSCPISEMQELEVEIDADDYTVLRWQAVPSSEWQAEDFLEVWDGEDLG